MSDAPPLSYLLKRLYHILQFQFLQSFRGRLVRRLYDLDGITTAGSGFQLQDSLGRDGALADDVGLRVILVVGIRSVGIDGGDVGLARVEEVQLQHGLVAVPRTGGRSRRWCNQ